MMDELYKLVYAEHPCDDNCCDIGLANELGYSMVAADRLASACDWEIPDDLWDEETYEQQEAEFNAYYLLHAHVCQCNSYVFNDELSQGYWYNGLYCDNCGKDVPYSPIYDRAERVRNLGTSAGYELLGNTALRLIAIAQDEEANDFEPTYIKLEEADELIVTITDYVWHHINDDNFKAQLCALLNLSYAGAST